METDVTIKALQPDELRSALPLVWRVFQTFEGPDYTQEGIDEFYKSIHDGQFLAMLQAYGAWVGSRLVGVIASRSEGTHIALFFVEEDYQGRGIGKALFKTALEHSPFGTMTVNASPYAAPIYRKLGFADTDRERTVNGLRFTPMAYRP